MSVPGAAVAAGELAVLAREGCRPAWVDQLIAAVAPVLPEDFVGRIELNAFKGGISTVNVDQTFRAVREAPMRR